MPLTIKAEPTREFNLDVAFYRLAEHRVAHIVGHLQGDPSRGVADPERPDVRHWEIGGLRVSYMLHVFSAEEALLLLLRIRPAEEPRGRLVERARKAVDVILKIKGLLGGWPFGG